MLVGRVELLGDGDEGDPVPVEHLHHPGEVEQAAARAGRPCRRRRSRPGRPRCRPSAASAPAARCCRRRSRRRRSGRAGRPSPRRAGWRRTPRPTRAGRRGELNSCSQPLLGALAGVDRAADQRQRRAGWLLRHRVPPVSLKKRKPLQCEPVIALATADERGVDLALPLEALRQHRHAYLPALVHPREDRAGGRQPAVRFVRLGRLRRRQRKAGRLRLAARRQEPQVGVVGQLGGAAFARSDRPPWARACRRQARRLSSHGRLLAAVASPVSSAKRAFSCLVVIRCKAAISSSTLTLAPPRPAGR